MNPLHRMAQGLAVAMPAVTKPPREHIHEVMPLWGGGVWYCLAHGCAFHGDQRAAIGHAVVNQFDARPGSLR